MLIDSVYSNQYSIRFITFFWVDDKDGILNEIIGIVEIFFSSSGFVWHSNFPNYQQVFSRTTDQYVR